MEIIIEVSKENKQKAIAFLKKANTSKKSDIKEAKNIRNLIIKEISRQMNENKKIYDEKKMKIENSNLSDENEENEIKKLNYDYNENVKRDQIADNLIYEPSKYTIPNSTCDICDQCDSLINVYLKIDKQYNQSTIDEINNTRQQLCNASKKCNKEYCRAKELIDIIDTSPIIKKNKGLS